MAAGGSGRGTPEGTGRTNFKVGGVRLGRIWRRDGIKIGLLNSRRQCDVLK